MVDHLKLKGSNFTIKEFNFITIKQDFIVIIITNKLKEHFVSFITIIHKYINHDQLNLDLIILSFKPSSSTQPHLRIKKIYEEEVANYYYHIED